MTEEIISPPTTEQAPPVEPTIPVEDETPETEVPQDLDSPEEGEVEEVDPPLEEDEEVEFNGKKFRAPKGLKDSLLMRADYTKKTQEVSEKDKAADRRLAAIEAAPEEELRARARLANIDESLEYYQQFSDAQWEAAREEDYVGTEKAWRQYQKLQVDKTALTAEMTTKQTERSQAAERDLANRVEETNTFAAKNIKGYTPELTGKLVQFADAEGVDEVTLKKLWSPTFYKILHKAMIGEQSLKQQAVRKPAPTPPAPLTIVKPTTPPTTRTSLRELADSDNMEAYVAARKAGRKG
jgi:hypothetical protein